MATPEIGDPCILVDPDAMAALVGPDATIEPFDLVVGGDLLGRTCGFGGGFEAPLCIGIYFGSVSSFVDRCEECQDYPGLGDASWGALGDFNGRPVSYLYAEAGGLTFTAEAEGIEATLEQLKTILRPIIEG